MQIEIPNDQAKKLTGQASAAGYNDVQEYLAELVMRLAALPQPNLDHLDELVAKASKLPKPEQDVAAWQQRFDTFIASNKVKGGPVDDSRESIYPDR